MAYVKGTLPGPGETQHNITSNFKKAHLERTGWNLKEFGRIIRCMDPLRPSWAGTINDAYNVQMNRESVGDHTSNLPRSQRKERSTK